MKTIKRLAVFTGRYVLAVIGVFYLLTFGLFSPQGREQLHEVLFRLGWRKRPPQPSTLPPLLVPSVAMSEYVLDDMPVRVMAPDTVSGNVSVDELLVINSIVATRRPRQCFEIGTFDGRTTLNMAANSPEDAVIYTLDLPAEDLEKTTLKIAHGDEKFIKKARSGDRFRGTRYEARIRQLYGDSATFDYSGYEGKMDLVFVDGSHSYDYVKKDTRTALKLVRAKGGTILWHDYSSPYWKDLTRAMNELRSEIPELLGMRHVTGTCLVVWERKEQQ